MFSFFFSFPVYFFYFNFFRKFATSERCRKLLPITQPLTKNASQRKIMATFHSLKWYLHNGVNRSKLGPFVDVENISLCSKRHQLRAMFHSLNSLVDTGNQWQILFSKIVLLLNFVTHVTIFFNSKESRFVLIFLQLQWLLSY